MYKIKSFSAAVIYACNVMTKIEVRLRVTSHVCLSMHKQLKLTKNNNKKKNEKKLAFNFSCLNPIHLIGEESVRLVDFDYDWTQSNLSASRSEVSLFSTNVHRVQS